MPSIMPFLRGAAFGPDEIGAMTAALDRSLAMLHIDNDALLIKQELARRIIEAAQTGVRDPDALALRALGGSLGTGEAA